MAWDSERAKREGAPYYNEYAKDLAARNARNIELGNVLISGQLHKPGEDFTAVLERMGALTSGKAARLGFRPFTHHLRIERMVSVYSPELPKPFMSVGLRTFSRLLTDRHIPVGATVSAWLGEGTVRYGLDLSGEEPLVDSSEIRGVVLPQPTLDRRFEKAAIQSILTVLENHTY